MREKLDELQKYHKEVNERVDEFKQEIENKELEIEQLNKEFTKAFITGKKTDSKQLGKLRDELEDLKAQYSLIQEAMNEDDKLRELSKEVYKEHYRHKEQIDSIRAEHTKGIVEKQKELDKLRADMNKEIFKIKQEQGNSKAERFEFINYMELDRHNRNMFSQDTVGLPFEEYKRQEMQRAGKTKKEINDFIEQDFYNVR